MPPDLALWLTLISSNYPCLEHIFIVPKVFDPLKFDCILFYIEHFHSCWAFSGPVCHLLFEIGYFLWTNNSFTEFLHNRIMALYKQKYLSLTTGAWSLVPKPRLVPSCYESVGHFARNGQEWNVFLCIFNTSQQSGHGKIRHTRFKIYIKVSYKAWITFSDISPRCSKQQQKIC